MEVSFPAEGGRYGQAEQYTDSYSVFSWSTATRSKGAHYSSWTLGVAMPTVSKVQSVLPAEKIPFWPLSVSGNLPRLWFYSSHTSNLLSDQR